MDFDARELGCKCDDCPLQGRVAVPPELREGARMLIVGWEPGRDELKARRPFVGRSGRLLDDTLRRCGVERSEVSITNVRLCMGPPDWADNDVRQGLSYGCCAPRLEREVASATSLLLLGKVALSCVGEESSSEDAISGARGFPFYVDGTPALCAWHPAYILRAPKYTGVFRSDVSKAFRHAHGRLRWVEPSIFFNPSIDELDGLFSHWDNERRAVAVDVETWQPDDNQIDPLTARLRCVGLGSAGRATVLLFESVAGGLQWTGAGGRRDTLRLSPERARERLRNFLARYPALVGHNVNVFDRPVLERHGMPLPSYDRVRDTVIMHHVVDGEMPHNLGFLSSIYTDAPRHKNVDHAAWESDEQLHRYCALDCVVTARLAPVLAADVVERDVVTPYRTDVQLQRFCVEMHRAGMFVDLAERERHRARLDAKVEAAKAAAEAAAGRPINIGSPDQVRAQLFKVWGLDTTGAQTESGADSVGKDALYEILGRPGLPPEAIAFCEAVLSGRQAGKARSTWVDTAIPAVDGRLHPSWHPHTVVTGRLSCSDPNVQNIPDRRYELDSLRSMFVAEKGNVLVAADMEQLELRLIAAIAGDEIWLDAFRAKKDVHAVNAAAFFGGRYTDYDKEHPYRTFAKNYTYMLLYGGQSEMAHAQMVRVRNPKTGDRPYAQFSLLEAERLRERFLTTHDAIPRWWDATVAQYREARELRDLVHGRVRLFKDTMYSGDEENGMREMVAFVISATGRACVNNAILRLMETMPWGVYGPGLIHDGHDSLMLEVEARWAGRARSELVGAMRAEVRGLELPAEAKMGTRWSALEKAKG